MCVSKTKEKGLKMMRSWRLIRYECFLVCVLREEKKGCALGALGCCSTRKDPVRVLLGLCFERREEGMCVGSIGLLLNEKRETGLKKCGLSHFIDRLGKQMEKMLLNGV